MKPTSPFPLLSHSSPIQAIAIGASAGGVEALGVLLPALLASFTPAIFIVLHLSPDKRSLLAGTFNHRCALPVCEVLDKQPIESGHVYFAAPNYHLLVEPDKTWSLSQDPEVNFSRPAIDVLFETAARTYGRDLLGILLTGANNDGALGLKAIRQAGGRTWVQTPATALVSTMPQYAIDIDAADEVLTLSQMAQRLRAEQQGIGSFPEKSE